MAIPLPGDPNRDAAVLAALKALPELDYRHLTSHFQNELWSPSNPNPTERLKEVTRIIGSLTLVLEPQGFFDIYYTNACDVLKNINTTRKTAAFISLAYDPYHFTRYPANTPPTDTTHDAAEIQTFRQQSILAKNLVNNYNTTHGTNIKIGSISLDCERFFMKDLKDGEDPILVQQWNDAVADKYNKIYKEAKYQFPNARRLQFERFGVGTGSACKPYNWIPSNIYPPNSLGDFASCTLYQVSDFNKMRALFWEVQTRNKPLQIVPYVALASGFDHPPITPFKADWNYNLQWSHAMGNFLSRCGTPINSVFLYPAPFLTQTPYWAEHFIAYCRGAAGWKLETQISGD